MTVVFSFILGLYSLLLLTFLFGWVKIRRQPVPVKGPSSPRISIVAALRNEESNIENFVHDLSAIVYPAGNFEVILVNDHSTDATLEKTKLQINDLPGFRLLDLPSGLEGKKEALRFGIEQAGFEIIATTDADCRFSKNWLGCVSLYFQQEETKMLVGVVKLIESDSFFTRLQVTEFSSLVGTAAAAVGLGHPILCNGANLSFRKEVFMEVNGYDGNLQIASGDDEFLLRKIRKQYPSGIKFLNFYEATVSTFAQKDIRDFFYQRIRWAGKWRHNSDPLARMLAIFMLLSHLAFIGLIVDNLVHREASYGLVLYKIFLEGIFFSWVARFLHRRIDLLAFLTLQIIYPFYIIIIGMLSLVLRYEWKNRNYK